MTTRVTVIDPDNPLAIRVAGVENGMAKVEFHCTACGGFVMSLPDNYTDMSMAHCKACGAWLGRLAAIRVQAALAVQSAGHEINVEEFLALLPKGKT